MGFLPPCLRPVVLPLLLLPFTFAQSDTGPTNASYPQIQGSVQLELFYSPYNGSNQSSFQVPVNLTGVGVSVDAGSARYFNRSGPVDIFTPDNFTNITRGQIAIVSCDPEDYPQTAMFNSLSNFLPSVQYKIGFGTTSDTQAGAIILYSKYSNWCMWPGLTGDTIYTITDHAKALILRTVMLDMGQRNKPGYIASQQNLSAASSSNGNYTPPPPPSTTIAMIVLYSITGCIVFLFLLIIILGALRAHRHPERYGPRNMLGMTRQSRARGMARAMLDTIPIIKFGENEQTKSAEQTGQSQHGDVELAVQPSPENSRAEGKTVKEVDANVTKEAGTPGALEITPASPITADVPAKVDAKADEAKALDNDKELVAAGASSGDAAVPASVPGASTVQVEPAEAKAPEDDGEGTVSCPICTEDFVRGEPARLLPCRHHFHPACIDPWLLNVSSTCPMCRVDLNPPDENEVDDEEEGAYTRQDIIEAERLAAATAASRNRSSARQWPYGSYSDREMREQNARRVIMSGLGFMNINHMSQADPEERLQALRQVRAARLAREERRRREAGSSENQTSRLSRLGRIFHRSNQQPSTEQGGSSQGGTEGDSAGAQQPNPSRNTEQPR